MINIYFAASIRGGRALVDEYISIVNLLKEYGTVVSEHVASPYVTSEGECKTSEFIHNRDIEMINSSDLVVAEVTVPSLGVGYEIRYAIETGKVVLCLFNNKSGGKLSAMIEGSLGTNVCYYSNLEEVKEYFIGFFHDNFI